MFDEKTNAELVEKCFEMTKQTKERSPYRHDQEAADQLAGEWLRQEVIRRTRPMRWPEEIKDAIEASNQAHETYLR